MEKEVYLQMWVLLSGSLQQASSQEQPLYVFPFLKKVPLKRNHQPGQNKTNGKNDGNRSFPTYPCNQRQLRWENGASRQVIKFKCPRTYL